MKKKIIKVETSISAPVEKVWEYYNGSQHIPQWNYASEDWHCPKATNDFRVGGKLKTRMEAKDNSSGFDFEARYLEIVPHQKIVYILEEENRKVSISFQQIKDKTCISITFEGESTYSIEDQKQGWQIILDNFKKYAEAN